jgi:hypothetical protein
MKAHVEPKSKECPFCGASTYEVMSGTGVKCIRCTNKRTCGAIVSFSNKDCNERGVSPVKYFNRRAEREQKMNLIREVISDQTVTALASIVLIVAALPMAGWSWAVSHMAGPKVKNAKEGT